MGASSAKMAVTRQMSDAGPIALSASSLKKILASKKSMHEMDRPHLRKLAGDIFQVKNTNDNFTKNQFVDCAKNISLQSLNDSKRTLGFTLNWSFWLKKTSLYLSGSTRSLWGADRRDGPLLLQRQRHGQHLGREGRHPRGRLWWQSGSSSCHAG